MENDQLAQDVAAIKDNRALRIFSDTVQHLKAVRELLGDEARWTQGIFATKDGKPWGGSLTLESADAFCLVGASIACANKESDWSLASRVDPWGAANFVSVVATGKLEPAAFNDHNDHATVIAALDRTIAALEAIASEAQ